MSGKTFLISICTVVALATPAFAQDTSGVNPNPIGGNPDGNILIGTKVIEGSPYARAVIDYLDACSDQFFNLGKNAIAAGTVVMAGALGAQAAGQVEASGPLGLVAGTFVGVGAFSTAVSFGYGQAAALGNLYYDLPGGNGGGNEGAAMWGEIGTGLAGHVEIVSTIDPLFWADTADMEAGYNATADALALAATARADWGTDPNFQPGVPGEQTATYTALLAAVAVYNVAHESFSTAMLAAFDMVDGILADPELMVWLEPIQADAETCGPVLDIVDASLDGLKTIDVDPAGDIRTDLEGGVLDCATVFDLWAESVAGWDPEGERETMSGLLLSLTPGDVVTLTTP